MCSLSSLYMLRLDLYGDSATVSVNIGGEDQSKEKVSFTHKISAVLVILEACWFVLRGVLLSCNLNCRCRC